MTVKPAILLLCMISTILTSHAGLKRQQVKNPYNLQNGDIVFQDTNDAQAKAVKAATNSRWSHVGIVFFHQGSPWVLEAVQPVKSTPLKTFIARSPRSFYAMRLKNANRLINPTSIAKARQYGQLQIGKNYDPYFQWSEERVYCSELVWKIYKQATGVELCKPRLLGSYNLHHPTVQALIIQRFGSMSQLPMNELMVAPSDIAESKLLIEAPRRTLKLTRQ